MSSQAPVGTTLAILERTLKVMTAVQSRIHAAMKQEFKLLKVIIADYTPEDYDYDPVDARRSAKKEDYDMVDVIPVSDPNAATMAQKIVTYQAVLQLAQSAPQLYDLPLLHRQMIEVLGVRNAAKLVPIEDDAIPVDPVQENQDMLTGKPLKAFVEQNHDAHMAAHTAFIQSPMVQQMAQMNPQGQQQILAMMAHINEHMAFKYRLEVEQTMGGMLPSYDEYREGEGEAPEIPKEMADQIAIMAAQATQQIVMGQQQAAQQQAAQQQMQDPVVQMQMQELQLKQQDLQLKAQKQQQEAAAKAQQLQIEAARIAAQKEIAAMQVAANSASARDKLIKQTEVEGARMHLDVAKHRAQLALQKTQHNKRAELDGVRLGVDIAKHRSQQPPKKENK